MRWSTLRALWAVLAVTAMCVMLLQHVSWPMPSETSNDAKEEEKGRAVDTVMLALLHRHDELLSQAADSFALARGRRVRLLELMQAELPPVENDTDAATYAHAVAQLAAHPHRAADITDDALLDVLVEQWIYSRRKRLWSAVAATTATSIAASSSSSETSGEQHHHRHRRHRDHSD